MKFCTLSIAVAAALALSSPLLAESSKPLAVNIASQSLGSALNEFAQQAKLQLIVDSKLLEGKMTKPLKGEMDAQKALDKLLEGTGLYGKIMNGVVVIQLTASSSDESKIALKEITVTTASGFEQNVADAPASITVITGEELNKKSYTSVADAIKNVPGVYVSPISNDSGTSQDISIRGMAATETLYLVDGKPLSNARNFDSALGTSGSAGLQNWFPPVGMIDRIEIVRGPMSSLYGSNALGGVINIITKKPTKEWSGSITTEYLVPDGDNTLSSEKISTSFGLSGPLIDNVLGLQLNGTFTKSDSNTYIYDGESQDIDGKEIKNIGGKLIWTPDENNDIALGYSHNKQEALSSTSTTDPYAKDVVTLSHDGRYGDWITSTYYQYDKTTKYNGATGVTGTAYAGQTFDKVDEVQTFNTQASYFWDKHSTTFGAQYKYEEFDNKANAWRTYNTSDTHAERWLGALYAEDEWKLFENFALTVGARYNNDENFGGYLTPRVYGVYHLTDEWTLKGGVSTGYNQPALAATNSKWLFARSGGQAFFLGNDDLQPETSTSYEAGFNYSNKDLKLNSSLMLFHTDYDDKIAAARICTTTAECNAMGYTGLKNVSQYQNVAEAEMQGIEITFDYMLLEKLKMASSYTYTESEMKNAIFNKGQSNEVDLSGKPLNRTPKHLFNVSFDWEATSKWDLWTQVNYRGKASEYIDLRSTVTAAKATTPAYTTADFGVVYHATKALDLKAGVYNIANKEIMSDEYDITVDGRRYQASFTYNF